MSTAQKTIIGSVSHGTMRAEDLIPCFLDVLEQLDKGQADGIREEYSELLACLDAGRMSASDNETSDWLLNEVLFDKLNEYAPAYFYFGSHPGDGSDYGFWLSEDVAQCVRDNDGMVVSDLSEVTDSFSGKVLLVNDHGNTSLYSAKDGKLTEIWSVV